MVTLLIIILVGLCLVFGVTDIYADKKITAQELFYLVSIIVAGGLGPFYFFGRINYEEKCLERDQLKQRKERLWFYLGEYDKIINTIFNPKKISHDTELKLLREQLVRNYELFCHLLENEEEKLGFAELELKTIADFFSYADKCDLITTVNLSELQSAQVSYIWRHYSDLYLKAQKTMACKIL